MVLKNTLAALVGSLSLMPAFAADVTIPHTFTSGTPARAAEVNANFTAIKDGVNANGAAVATLQTDVQALKAASPVSGALQVQVNGVTVGALVGFPDDNDAVHALTNQGYFVILRANATNEAPGVETALAGESIAFDGANCQGTMYTGGVSPAYGATHIFWRQGAVIGTPGSSGTTVARVAKGAPTQVNVRSTGWLGDDGAWSCYDYATNGIGDGFQPEDVIPIIANDPAVTGVPNNLSGPVRITR